MGFFLHNSEESACSLRYLSLYSTIMSALHPRKNSWITSPTTPHGKTEKRMDYSRFISESACIVLLFRSIFGCRWGMRYDGLGKRFLKDFMNGTVGSDENGHSASHDIEGVATAMPPPKI